MNVFAHHLATHAADGSKRRHIVRAADYETAVRLARERHYAECGCAPDTVWVGDVKLRFNASEYLPCSYSAEHDYDPRMD